ncbi:hypothetical protein RND81_01G027700 [Saponaria officinalis]|uniref:Peptidase A1 domain-containing protein n=1 Tax=Saponaria officinalis TaxID=3572 RepID=A0AAW1N8L0_SAPOF
MSFVFLYFVLCFSSSIFILPSSSTTITLSLSPITSYQNSWEFITHIAKTTLQRAHHLKHPKKKPTSLSHLHKTSTTPLYPRSYGGYSVSLAFGTPPQAIPLVFDTGSSLVWVPCTSKYTCSNCTFSDVDPKNITTFKPKLSSSSKVIGCLNKKCGWLFGDDVTGRCPGCRPGLRNCSQSCPDYLLQYGLGATTGMALSENLDLPGEVVHDFFLGCSLVSLQQPAGIAGFGRAPNSLPNQLNLKKFSHCLLSRRYADTPKSSKLVLAVADSELIRGVKYTPFRKNPKLSPYDEYYYISLRKITVGKKQVKVKIPYKLLAPDRNGTGGTIVDSGSTLTFMDRPIFEPLVKELVAQMGHVKRAHGVEAQSKFGLCLNASSSRHISIPELVFHFKGGAKMELALGNYFLFSDDVGALCLTIVTDTDPAVPGGPTGPAVIIGNYQQQNFYIEYDLEHQRMGFKKHKCG